MEVESSVLSDQVPGCGLLLYPGTKAYPIYLMDWSGGHHPPAGVVAGSTLFYPAQHPRGIQRNCPSDILAPKRLLPYEFESLRNPRPQPRPSLKSDPKLHTRQKS